MAVSLWMVVAGIFPATCLPQNSPLLEQHAARKRAARDIVLEALRAKGLLPANGVIEFSARTSPDPANASQLRIHIDSIRIVPLPGSPATTAPGVEFPPAQGESLLAQIKVSRNVEYMELDIPVQQEPELKVQHSFRMESGELQDDLSGGLPEVLPPAETPESGVPPVASSQDEETSGREAATSGGTEGNASGEPWYKHIQ